MEVYYNSIHYYMVYVLLRLGLSGDGDRCRLRRVSGSSSDAEVDDVYDDDDVSS